MRIVIQRVKSASVTVNGEITGAIKHGLLILAGVHQDDTEEELKWCCRKIPKLRIFNDDDGYMNRSVQDVEGEILVFLSLRYMEIWIKETVPVLLRQVNRRCQNRCTTKWWRY